MSSKKAPAAVVAVSEAESAYRKGTKMPLKEVRNLRIGDILEVYYKDTTEPVVMMVLDDVAPDSASHFGFRVIEWGLFQTPNRVQAIIPRYTDTDRYKLIGHVSTFK